MVKFVNIILEMHVIIVVMSLLTSIFIRLPFIRNKVDYKHALYLFYSLMVVSVLLASFGDTGAIKIFGNEESDGATSQLDSSAAVTTFFKITQAPIKNHFELIAGIVLVSLVMGLVLTGFSLWRLIKTIQKHRIFKSVGHISIRVSEKHQMPHAFSLWRKSYVVLPQEALSQRHHLKFIIKHEFEHIRQLDTALIFIMCVLKNLFFINPFIYVLFNTIKNIHELAVDSGIIKRFSKDETSYLKTMAWVFHLNFGEQSPSLTNGFFGKNQIKEYAMRIQNIKRTKTKNLNLFLGIMMMIVSTVAISCASQQYKKNLSIESSQKNQEKNLYKINVKIYEGKKVLTNATVISKEGEEAMILSVKDPQFLNEQNSDSMEMDFDKYKDYTKMQIIVKKSSADNVSVDLNASLKHLGEKTQVHLKNEYKQGAKNDLNIGAYRVEMTVTDFTQKTASL